MNCNTAGFPVLHYLPEFAQTHVHWVSDTIQPCHPLPPPSLNLIFPCIRVFSKKSVLHISDQSIGASASAPVLLMSIQGWFPSWLTGLISLLSQGFSRVFPNRIVWKHQFFGTQPSLWSNSYPYENPLSSMKSSVPATKQIPQPPSWPHSTVLSAFLPLF